MKCNTESENNMCLSQNHWTRYKTYDMIFFIHNSKKMQLVCSNREQTSSHLGWIRVVEAQGLCKEAGGGFAGKENVL